MALQDQNTKQSQSSHHKEFLVEISHPHFVYFFREVIKQLGQDNVLVACQDSGIIPFLLKSHGIDYVIIGKKYNGLFRKALGQFNYFSKYFRLIRKYKVRKALGGSIALIMATKLTGSKVIFFDDDDSAVQPFTKKISIPLASFIITPQCLSFEKYGIPHYTYRGFQELSYLAPAYFTPDPSILTKYKLQENNYAIIRFNEFKAYHDVGHTGIPKSFRAQLIQTLKEHMAIYITSEGELEEEFKSFQLKIDPFDIHHVLFYARMFIGDSQTMASEAAVLGTPSLRCNTFKDKISYLSELEYKHKLTFAFLPSETEHLIGKINELLQFPDLKKEWQKRKETMLKEMEDVPKFITNLINEK
jgi:uncharacterized protein